MFRSSKYLPQPWSDVWLEYYDALRLGALAPDQVFRDFYNHVYHPDSGYGGAPWAVERWFGYVVGNLSSGDYGAAVFSAGVLSHYVADVANPLHTGSSGAEEAIHSNYESEVSRRLLRLDIGAVEPRNVTGIAVYVASIAKASHGYYWPLINNYTRYGWNIHVERMTEECLSLAVEATTSLWITAISAASPSPPGSPPQSPVSNTSTGSDGGRGHVLINEVELNPPGVDEGFEWVELYNPTSEEVDIGGWTLSTTHGVTVTVRVPEGRKIPGYGYYVVGYGGQWLDNEDELVILRDAFGWEVDRTPLLRDDYNDGRSWQRYPNGVDTDSVDDWSFRESTRGRSNGGLRLPTELMLSPSAFTVKTGEFIKIVAMLTSEGRPLDGKPIVFSATAGDVSPNIAYTDENGRATVTYTAPVVSVRASVNITATFPGDLKYKESIATILGIIEGGIALPKVSLIGASFTVPETLKDDIESYRITVPEEVLRAIPIEFPEEPFILATLDTLYLVFAGQSDEGLASVDGWRLPRNIELSGINLSVIVAKSVIFEKEGVPVKISHILANPSNYTFRLVKIDANRRQISVLYDPDEPPYIEFPLTLGYLTEEPNRPLEMVRKAIEKGVEISRDINGTFVKRLLEVEEAGLWALNFKYEYWYDCRAITDCIVIPTNHMIFRLIEGARPVFKSYVELGEIILYDVKTVIPYEDITSVTDLKKNADKYVGKVVRITANCYGGYISVQEVVEHNTPCSEDYVYMENVGCINLKLDIRLEGFITWSSITVPPKREELLLVTGVSSFHQDEPFMNVSGVFELIGKVVSAKQVSESLPEGIALIICEAEETGEIDFVKLANEFKDRIKSDVGELYYVLQDLYLYSKVPNIPMKVPSRVFNPRAPIFVNEPYEIPEIFVERSFTLQISIVKPRTSINLNINNSMISNISISVSQELRDVKIFFEKLLEKPPELSEPPGYVWAYHEISAKIPEEAIEDAKMTFWVSKGWLVTHDATERYVAMLRYCRGEWRELPTKVIGENVTHFKFIAETPGFSTFAIIAKPAETPSLPSGIEGYILDEVTGNPLGRVRVIALTKDVALSRKVAEVMTDERGHYFVDLSPNDYVVVVSADGYADTFISAPIALGEVKRVDFNLKRATAEFSTDWSGVKLEAALMTNRTWNIMGEASVEVSVTVLDMGENRMVEFHLLRLQLLHTKVDKVISLDAKTDVGGTVFIKKIDLNLTDGFELVAPESSSTYSIYIILDGLVVNKDGVSWPRNMSNSVDVEIATPSAPISISTEMPRKVMIDEDFTLRVRVKNEGAYPISRLELRLNPPPLATSAIGSTMYTKGVVNPGEIIEAYFKLKATTATAVAALSVDLSYNTVWGYQVIRLGENIGSIEIAKRLTTISIMIEPKEVMVGDEVAIRGSLTPAISAPVSLTIKRPDETVEKRASISGIDGGFNFKVKLNISGEWIFRASFPGDPKYEAAQSDPVKARVTKIVTSIMIEVEPKEVIVGEEIHIKGFIKPPISAIIILLVTKPDDTIEELATISGADGLYSKKVRIDKEGIWKITARFAGDQTCEASSSPPAQVEARPEAIHPWLYVAGMAAILTALALLTLIKRKRVKK
ncbi:MAG: PGF-pre-PGF domain-containing protein [Candidatus Bathyarchaeia archaeon]